MTSATFEALVIGRADAGNNPVSTERALWRAIANEIFKLFEVKHLDVNVTANPGYMAANFDNTGLGINNMVGFAICNGQNGTINRTGRTSIGYGSGYATIGATGGSKDAVVVDHNHDIDYNLNNAGGVGTQRTLNVGTSAGVNTTKNAGVSGTDKNMMPYVVTLMIQRIA